MISAQRTLEGPALQRRATAQLPFAQRFILDLRSRNAPWLALSNHGKQFAGCSTHSRRLRMSGNGENTVELDGKSVNEISHSTKERVSGAPGSQSRLSLGHPSRRLFLALEQTRTFAIPAGVECYRVILRSARTAPEH
jgi:hypothetical protein